MKHLNKNRDVMFHCSNMNNINLFDLLFTKYNRIGVVLDGDCPQSSNIITKSGKHRLFDTKYYWLIFTSNKEYKDMFINADINIDSNIKVVTPRSTANSQHYDIDDFYNPASNRGGNFVKKRLGYYSNLTGYKPVNGNTDKFWQRKNLRGVTFKTMIVFHDPYTEPLDAYLESDDHREKNTYNRFHARLMRFCSEHYNFRLNKSVTNLFGYQRPDGTMDGLVGELETRRVDFGLSPLFIRKDRANVITYGRLTYIIRSAFVFRNPKSRNSFEIFIRPLSLDVWYIIMAFFLLSIFVLRWSFSSEIDQTEYSSDASWSFSIVCLVGAFCQQGIIANPTLLCGKIGLFFVLLLTTIVYQFYSGSLVSSLLNPPLVLIKTVDDILDSNFKVGVENIRLNKEHFKYTSDNSSLKLYKKWILGKEEQGYYMPTDGLDLMKRRQFAFHVELVKAYPFIKQSFKQSEVCEIKEVQMYKPIQCHANYVKHSPFRDIMDICLHRIAESGILIKEYKFWHAKKPDCVFSYDISTGLNEFYPVLIFIGMGIIFGIAILSLERLHYIAAKKKVVSFVIISSSESLMDPPKKAKSSPITAKQKELLVEYISARREMYSGKLTQSNTREKMVKNWVEVSNLLNSMPDGPAKDWKQWKKVNKQEIKNPKCI